MNENDWKLTLKAVNELSAQVELAGLLQGAIRSNFLQYCRKPTTVDELAKVTGLPTGIVDNACLALQYLGVLRRGVDDQVIISEVYAPLLDRGLDQRVLDRLTAAPVRASILGNALDSAHSSYWSIDSASRVALAANATADPRTEFGREALVASVRSDQALHEAFTRGGRFLDLGCGVAGGIITFLYFYPSLSAVGIDIADDVLTVARTRAQTVGVDDRVTFLAADAANYRDSEPFDFVFWPQNFYPEASRADALSTAFTNLRPGGMLLTVHLPRQTSHSPGVTEPDAASAGPALDRLLLGLSGIERRRLDALTTELSEAGFVDITAGAAVPPVLPLVQARRPQ
ncbi:cyclopropane-fatty-acyl-phospholipid synthase family protein [Actinoplanes sp. TFC3]|uniref:SAM-dependent methyltransferase n=1 Tax=Actinoplanes sp. TFC3 TaxID=1710355 RepID=UPI00082D5C0D|nr:class I SAM-dependent methyltransferase [Actinoplanes sp. TFC3]